MPFNTPAKNVMLDSLDESATQITHIAIFTLADPGTGTDANAKQWAAHPLTLGKQLLGVERQPLSSPTPTV